MLDFSWAAFPKITLRWWPASQSPSATMTERVRNTHGELLLPSTFLKYLKLSSSPHSLSVFSFLCLCFTLTQHLLLSLSISWRTEFHCCCFSLSNTPRKQETKLVDAQSLVLYYLLFCGLYFGFHSSKSPIMFSHVLTIGCRFETWISRISEVGANERAALTAPLLSPLRLRQASSGNGV